MKEFQFNIPELESFPQEKREIVLRRCLESEEYSGSLRKIRTITLVSSVAAVLILVQAIFWSGIVGDKYWLGAVLGVGILIFSIIVMVYAQIRLTVRLVRKLVRKEVDHA